MCAVLFSSVSTHAQVVIPGEQFIPSKLNDTLELSYHPSIKEVKDEGFQILNPYFKTSINTTYPRGYNDGPVWKGKGITTQLHGGFQYNNAALSITFHPVVYYSQNAQFPLDSQNFANLSPFAYQIDRGIDWVQKYGSSPFASFHPGQSEIKLTLGSFVTSVSTQNFTLGPSIFNPIIMSNQGAGFPHLRLGISPTTIHIKKLNLFKLESYVYYGLLHESNYYDQGESNNRRYLNGLSIGLSPAFFPNLTIGFNRFMYKDAQYFESKDIFSPIHIFDDGVRGDSINTNDTFDQIASLSINWNFPQIGFRAYGEFAKNDFGSDGWFRWTLVEPEHSRAYSLGFEKTSQITKRITLKTAYEHTNLTQNHTYLWRPAPTFYVHHLNRQGYTNKGQLLGAGIGPGSNSDQINIEMGITNYTFGVFGQRIQFNEDYYVRKSRALTVHNVEYTFGLKASRELEKFILGIEWYHSKMFNQYFDPFIDERNDYFSLSVKSRIF